MGISAIALGKAKATDGKVIKQIFRCLIHGSGALKVPDCCRDHAVMAAAFDLRIEEVKVRLTMLKQPIKVADEEGTVKWDTGNYRVEMNDGRAEKLVHRLTSACVDLDQEYNITSKWSLEITTMRSSR